MSDIDDLQARINAALDRVSAGVETLTANSADAVQLQADLEEEKTVTAQLEERLRVLKDKQAADLASVSAQLQETRGTVEALDVEMQRLRQANEGLREANMALRDANAEGVGDAHLINKAMLAELEALRAARAAEAAEATAILAALTPVLNTTADPEEPEQEAQHA